MLDPQPECSAAAPWKADAGILRSALRLRCRIAASWSRNFWSCFSFSFRLRRSSHQLDHDGLATTTRQQRRVRSASAKGSCARRTAKQKPVATHHRAQEQQVIEARPNIRARRIKNVPRWLTGRWSWRRSAAAVPWSPHRAAPSAPPPPHRPPPPPPPSSRTDRAQPTPLRVVAIRRRLGCAGPVSRPAGMDAHRCQQRDISCQDAQLRLVGWRLTVTSPRRSMLLSTLSATSLDCPGLI